MDSDSDFLNAVLQESWVDITDVLEETRKALQPDELWRCVHYDSAAAMSALVLGCPSNDGGHPASERLTLRRVERSFDIKPVKLQPSSLPDGQYCAVQHLEPLPPSESTNGTITEVMDGLLVKAVQFLCCTSPRFASLGTLVLLHSNAALLLKSSSILRFYVDSVLCLCELASRVYSLHQAFSRNFASFRYSAQLIWNLRVQRYGVATARQLTWEFSDLRSVSASKRKAAETVFREQDAIRLLPTLAFDDGRLPSAEELIRRINASLEQHSLEDQPEHPLRLRLSLCRELLLAVAPFQRFHTWTDEDLQQTVKSFLTASLQLEHICVSSVFAKTTRDNSAASEVAHGSSNATAQLDYAAVNVPHSRFFHAKLTQYLTSCCPKPVKHPSCFEDAVNLLREFLLQLCLLLLVARACTTSPYEGQKIYSSLLRRCTTKQIKLIDDSYCAVWSPLGTALCAAMFLFKAAVFPLAYVPHLTQRKSIHSSKLDSDEQCEQFLALLSDILWGSMLDMDGRERVFSHTDLATLFTKAVELHVSQEIQETVLLLERPYRPSQRSGIPVCTQKSSLSKIRFLDDFFYSQLPHVVTLLLDKDSNALPRTTLAFAQHIKDMMLVVFTPENSATPSGIARRLDGILPVHHSSQFQRNATAAAAAAAVDRLVKTTRWITVEHAYTGTHVIEGLALLKTWRPPVGGGSWALFPLLVQSQRHLQRVRYQLLEVMIIAAQLFSPWTYPLLFRVIKTLCLGESIIERDLVRFYHKTNNSLKDKDAAAFRTLVHPLTYLGHLFSCSEQFLDLNAAVAHRPPSTLKQREAEMTLWDTLLGPLLAPLPLQWKQLLGYFSNPLVVTKLYDLPTLPLSNTCLTSSELHALFADHRNHDSPKSFRTCTNTNNVIDEADVKKSLECLYQRSSFLLASLNPHNSADRPLTAFPLFPEKNVCHLEKVLSSAFKTLRNNIDLLLSHLNTFDASVAQLPVGFGKPHICWISVAPVIPLITLTGATPP